MSLLQKSEHPLIDIDTVSDFPKRIGFRIKTIRSHKGLTQAELGEKIGLNANRVQQYENGARTPKLEMIRAFADALSVDIRAILDPDLDELYGPIYAIFELEETWGLKFKNIDNQVFLYFDNNSDNDRAKIINSYLDYLYNCKNNYDVNHKFTFHFRDSESDNASMTNTYTELKWNFPKYYKKKYKFENKTDRIKEIRKQILDLQTELEKLESDDED